MDGAIPGSLEATVMTTVPTFGETHFGQAQLGDPRRTRRLVRTAELIFRHPGDTLPTKLHDPRDYKAMDRLMNRPEVTHAAVLETHRLHTLQTIGQSKDVVLILHDTTELDYSGLRSIKDLGPIGGGLNRGFLCHNSLAYDPRQHELLGLANQIVHRRRHVGRKEKVKTKRERLDRESRLWVDGVDGVGAPPADCCWVHVADRGADTFEFLGRPWKSNEEFLMRSKVNRVIHHGHNLDGTKDYLHDYIRQQPLQGRREIVVSARAGQPERKAIVAVSFAAVLVVPPHVKRGLYEKRPLKLWVVRVSEINPPTGIDPLEWILLTNREVKTLDDAWERSDWYACRWVLEEYHKAQKTGCSIEDMQFTTSGALTPMIGLLSVIAVALLNLRDASRRPDAKERPATDVVAPSYLAVLSAWRYKEIRPDLSIHDFFFALARLGGHQNRKSDHRPGWLILWRGWMALQHMIDGAIAIKSCG
jgi:Transposase DNA-binding